MATSYALQSHECIPVLTLHICIYQLRIIHSIFLWIRTTLFFLFQKYQVTIMLIIQLLCVNNWVISKSNQNFTSHMWKNIFNCSCIFFERKEMEFSFFFIINISCPIFFSLHYDQLENQVAPSNLFDTSTHLKKNTSIHPYRCFQNIFLRNPCIIHSEKIGYHIQIPKLFVIIKFWIHFFYMFLCLNKNKI